MCINPKLEIGCLDLKYGVFQDLMKVYTLKYKEMYYVKFQI